MWTGRKRGRRRRVILGFGPCQLWRDFVAPKYYRLGSQAETWLGDWSSGLLPFCCRKDRFFKLQILLGSALEHVNFCLWAWPEYWLEGEPKCSCELPSEPDYSDPFLLWFLRTEDRFEVAGTEFVCGLMNHPTDLWPRQRRKKHHSHFVSITSCYRSKSVLPKCREPASTSSIAKELSTPTPNETEHIKRC